MKAGQSLARAETETPWGVTPSWPQGGAQQPCGPHLRHRRGRYIESLLFWVVRIERSEISTLVTGKVLGPLTEIG